MEESLEKKKLIYSLSFQQVAIYRFSIFYQCEEQLIHWVPFLQVAIFRFCTIN